MPKLPITCRAFRLLASLSFAVAIAPGARASSGLPTALPERVELKKFGDGQLSWLDPCSVVRDQHVRLFGDADATAASAKNAPE